MTRALKPVPAQAVPVPAPDFRVLFEGLPGLYLVFDTELRAVAVSEAYLAATGASREHLLGRPLAEIFPQAPYHPGAPAGDVLLDSVRQVLDTGEPDAMELLQRDLPQSDGTFEAHYWTPHNSPLRDPQGHIVGVVHRLDDVTDYVRMRQLRAELEQQAQDLRQRETQSRRLAAELEVVNGEIATKNKLLEEASRLKSEFLSSMSHELRTPLNAIIGFSEILKDGMAGELSQQQRIYLGHVFEGGNHLLSLINDILDLSKIEAGKMELSLETVDLQALLADSLLVVADKARGKRVRLLTELSPSVHDDVKADSRRVRQILHNLLSNAVKFTPSDGSVTVQLARVPRERAANAVPGFASGRRTPLPPGDFHEFVELSVRDTGIGMRPQDLDLLFMPFSQVTSPESRTQEGTGLGLAMVRRLAELHGGAVAVSSEVGQGSRFTVWLPIHAAQPHQENLEQLQMPQLTLRSTALIIEDDDRAATMMRLQLESLGFQTRRALSAEDALVLSEHFVPELITLDIRLPGMDGWEFLQRMKAIPRWAQVPVVVVSVEGDGRMLGYSMGVSLVLQKPLTMEDLKRGLEHLGMARNTPRHTTVLVIDDDAQSVERVAEPLNHLGCVVLRAYGGSEGISLARRFNPDLIVLDLEMPEVSGFEVVDALKGDPASARIPVMVVTGRDLTLRDRQRLSGGLFELVNKTEFDQGRFIGEVQRALSPYVH
ncbi:response regulator [Aquabacterium soli]|uniref:Virulence sensor protein BvgS n=1 Tax=Aquabacterium soli TaxID=2493092 RepID=A0A3R8U546_9BURK|nr:response regulator [Aquabacterium soli]RRS04821.1 response regulator [Aquabacterium soli]